MVSLDPTQSDPFRQQLIMRDVMMEINLESCLGMYFDSINDHCQCVGYDYKDHYLLKILLDLTLADSSRLTLST